MKRVAILVLLANQAAYGSLEITEIFPNPEGKDADGEFIEIWNTGSEAINLAEYSLDDVADGGSGIYELGEENIGPGNGKVIPYSESGITINNSNETIRLLRSDEEIEAISFSSSKEGKTYSKKGNEWSWETPSPGQYESLDNSNTEDSSGRIEFLKEIKERRVEESKKEKYAKTIRVSEIWGNPEGEDAGEWIEIENYGTEGIDLMIWQFEINGNKKTIGGFINAGAKIKLGNSGNHKISIKNSGGSIKIRGPDGTIIDEVQYGEIGEGEILKKEDDWEPQKIEYKEKPFQKIEQIKENSEEGSKNIVQKNEYKKPPSFNFPNRKTYAGIPIKIGNMIIDTAKYNLKIEWNFGDGTVKNEQYNEHIYQFPGKYFITAKVDDGFNVITFSKEVEVHKFPSYRDKLIISELFPQPLNNDEWIEIKNNSPDIIDLHNFSLSDATGKAWKVPQNTFISPYEFMTFHKEKTGISISSENEKIELRAPDSSLVDVVRYEKAPSNQSLARKKNNFIWTETTTPNRHNIISQTKPVEYIPLLSNQIQNAKEGQKVRIEGYVTAAPGDIFPRYIFLEGGAVIRILDNNIPAIKRGQFISTKGEVEYVDEFLRIKASNIEVSNKTQNIEAIDISAGSYKQSELRENFVFQLVKLKGEIIDVANQSMIVANIPIHLSSKIKEKNSVRIGDKAEVTGVVYPHATGSIIYPLSIKTEGQKQEVAKIRQEKNPPSAIPMQIYILAATIPLALYGMYTLIDKQTVKNVRGNLGAKNTGNI